MYSFKYNQQDATLYNILYYVNALHVSDGFSVHHQELKNCIHSIWYMPACLLLPLPDAVYTVFELLMMGGETA